MKKKIVVVLVFTLLTVTTLSVKGNTSPLPAFPGSEGFGSNTRAAYAGSTNPTIYRVTNINDGGSGSLRSALEASGPRVIIFEVSGTIQQNDCIWVKDPYVFVAGQTAPSPGITIRGPGGLRINTHDVVIQHLRIRVGDKSRGVPCDWRDGLNVGEGAYNVVIDHCSISWATDENVASGWYGSNALTFQWCIISEGLRHSCHPKGSHSMGFYVGKGNTGDLSIHHNLFAHNADRNPAIANYGNTEIINNVVYNWEWSPTEFHYYSGADPQYGNIIGNFYKAGLNTKEYGGVSLEYAEPPSKFYIHDNIGPTRTLNIQDDWDIVAFGQASFRSNIPTFAPTGITTQSAFNAYDIVLNKAGARPNDRDSVDKRVVKEVRSRTGHFIDSQSDVGGWPNLLKNYRALIIPSNPHGDSDGDGYTNLEEWLHSYSKQVEDVNALRNKIINRPVLDFLVSHPNLFLLLQRLLLRLWL